MSEGTKAGRFVVEAFVIVASILLAFGIDAWWDDRKDRMEEADILAGLQREFMDYRERLAQWPAFHEELVDDQLFSRELVLTQVVPYLSRQGLELSAALVAGTMVVDPDTDPWPVGAARISEDAAAARRLLADPDFRSIVQIRYSFWHHAGGEYRSALRAAEEILDLIDL